MTNALAYYGKELFIDVKSIILHYTQPPSLTRKHQKKVKVTVVRNALAYYHLELITSVKSIILQSPDVRQRTLLLYEQSFLSPST